MKWESILFLIMVSVPMWLVVMILSEFNAAQVEVLL